ncbi:MAG: MATE family efflux transporter [Ruminococcaceae bacterium]|nr:MATE family efflux transporter [Oscillospiraceae bacterium]
MADKFRQDLTKGSVGKQLMKFAIPFLLSNLLQAFYSVADMIIVGRLYGTVGITAVNIGSQINILVTGAALGLAVGGTVLIAQYGGAKKFDEQKKSIGTLFTAYMILSVICTVVMLLLGTTLLEVLKTPDIAMKDAEDYYNICMTGLIFMFAYNVISAILRGMGDSKRPLYFVLIATIVNVIGDIILVGPFKMGAAGAAYATVTAQALSVILSLIYLFKNHFFDGFKKSDFKIDKEKLKTLLKIGLPSSVQQVVVSFSFLTLTALINSLPNAEIASACQGIGGKVNSFAILPALAMSSAVSSMAGQNIGADETERAKKTMLTGMGIAFAISAVVFAVVELFPQPIISLFDTNHEVIEIGSQYMRFIALDYIFVPFVFCMNGLAIGAGYTNFALFNACFSSILVRVPFAYLVVHFTTLGFNGIGLATGLASAASIIVGAIFIASGKWKKPKIRI